MIRWLHFVVGLTVSALKSRRNLLLENAALRHQLLVLSRRTKRPRFNPVDRVFWVWLSLAWNRWSKALWLVQPDTVIGWHRQGFRLFWKWKSRPGRAGRKNLAPETIALIRQMSEANPLWGAPRIHGELLKLGIAVAQRTVGKYMVPQPRRASGQTWTTFLQNHFGQMVSVDFLTVPTLSFHVLYVFVVLSHARRQIRHFNVTATSSARWAAQQLREAFPFTRPPKYLLRKLESGPTASGERHRWEVGAAQKDNCSRPSLPTEGRSCGSDTIWDGKGDPIRPLRQEIGNWPSVLGRAARITMVQAAKQRQFDNPTLVRRLGGARLRAILLQGAMRAM